MLRTKVDLPTPESPKIATISVGFFQRVALVMVVALLLLLPLLLLLLLLELEEEDDEEEDVDVVEVDVVVVMMFWWWWWWCRLCDAPRALRPLLMIRLGAPSTTLLSLVWSGVRMVSRLL